MPTQTLKNISLRISSGGTPSRRRSEYFSIESGHLWVKSKELLDSGINNTEEKITDEALNNSSAKYFPEHSVLIAMYGANVGQLGWLKNPATVNQAVCGLVIDPEKADWRYVFYALLQNRKNLTVQARGAAQQNLNQDLIKDFEIPFLPLENQHLVVGILSVYDDLIENNTRRIQILEQMAQAIYTEQFDSASQKKEKKVPLGEIIKIHRGKSYSSDELSENEGIPFVNLKCLVRDGGFRKSGLKWFIGKYKNTQKVVAGDIVMAVTDMTQDRRIVARAARVPTLEGGFGVISMDLVKIEPKDGNDKDYIYSLLRWSGFSDEVKNHANGANVLHLIPDRITDYKTYVAPTDQQKEFGEKVRPLLNLIDKLELQDESLRKTRDLLLPKLVTGEIAVK